MAKYIELPRTIKQDFRKFIFAAIFDPRPSAQMDGVSIYEAWMFPDRMMVRLILDPEEYETFEDFSGSLGTLQHFLNLEPRMGEGLHFSQTLSGYFYPWRKEDIFIVSGDMNDGKPYITFSLRRRELNDANK